jgi:alginate O-acetyltransferase complex protein AlgI
MLLGGLWHGAAWTFVAWGVMHGAAVAGNHLWHDKLKLKMPAFLGWALTLWFVCFAWVFFRAEGFDDALILARGFVTLHSVGVEVLPTLIFALPLVLLGVHYVWHRYSVSQVIGGLRGYSYAIVMAALCIFACASMAGGYQPFIYFQF